MKLVVIAMESEVNSKIFKIFKPINSFPFKVFKNKNILIVISGIGLINASSATTWAINKFDIKQVFNIGIAGAISNNMNIADMYNITKAYYNNVDCTMFNYELGQIPKEKPYFELKPFLKDEKTAELLSGNNFINNIKDISIMLNKYNNIKVLDMEGTAIANICSKFNIECYIIKVISDIIIKNNNENHYKDNLNKCQKKVNNFLLKL